LFAHPTNGVWRDGADGTPVFVATAAVVDEQIELVADRKPGDGALTFIE
jgi:hypothetical protein